MVLKRKNVSSTRPFDLPGYSTKSLQRCKCIGTKLPVNSQRHSKRGRVNAQEHIAAVLGVDQKTISRDLESLGTCLASLGSRLINV